VDEVVGDVDPLPRSLEAGRVEHVADAQIASREALRLLGRADEAAYLCPAVEQGARDPGADEPGRTGDQSSDGYGTTPTTESYPSRPCYYP
jgi:hypothetical protein